VIFRSVAWAVAFFSVAPYFWHLAHGSPAFQIRLEDDYFYYSVIADRFVSLARVSFDGTTLTNGFHPLWFLVITALRFVFGRFGPAYWSALAVVLFLCAGATFELCARFLRALGAAPTIAFGIAAAFSLGNAILCSSAMEPAIAVPMLLWLLTEVANHGASRPVRLGFITSLAILSRVDIGLAVLLVLAGLIRLERPSLRAIASFAAGGILVPIYAAISLYSFGLAVPISALAKQELARHAVHPWYLWVVAFHSHYGMIAGPLVLAGAVALILELRDGGLRDRKRLAAGAPIVFAALFFAANSLTGWIYFGWYAFPYAIALPAAMFLICQRWFANRRQPVFAALLTIALFNLAGAARDLYRYGFDARLADNSILAMSYELRDKLGDVQGRFAMGAMAGFVAAIVDQPFLQLEALVSDRSLLRHLHAQDPLAATLLENQVDYLVVSYSGEPPPMDGACYRIAQPHAMWAAESKRMRGTLCAEPMLHFFTAKGRPLGSFYGPIETLVFDVRNARWAD
jgi:hypothetical protein